MERIGIGRQFLGREADLDHGTHSVFQQSVIDLVNICKVIDWLPLVIFVVHTHFVVKNIVEPHVPKCGRLLDLAKVIAIALTQGENRATRAKHFLPEVR